VFGIGSKEGLEIVSRPLTVLLWFLAGYWPLAQPQSWHLQSDAQAQLSRQVQRVLVVIFFSLNAQSARLNMLTQQVPFPYTHRKNRNICPSSFDLDNQSLPSYVHV
jgi:hypothetical protein